MKKLPTIEFLTTLAQEMGEKILPFFGKSINVPGKDIHLKADRLSEEIFIKKIKQDFPNYVIFSEEMAGNLPKGDYIWIVDPLDGTVNFSQGIPFWSISIALMKKNEIILGIVYNPSSKEIFTTEKGSGAFLNGRKISVSRKEDLSQAVVAADSGYDAVLAQENLQQLVYLNKDIRGPRILASTAMTLSYVACGKLDAFFQNNASLFDPPVGVLLIREAGGIVTRLNGKSWNTFDKNMLAGSPAIHCQILQKFKK